MKSSQDTLASSRRILPHQFTSLRRPAAESRFASAPGGRRSILRVAVVDDDEDMREFLKSILENAEEFGCVGCFSNATDALVEIPRVRPEIALMDIRLPDLSGIECTRRLKPLTPRLKVIMVSGFLDSSSIKESRQAGADNYLTKPISMEQCLATLRFTAFGPPRFERKPRELKPTTSHPGPSGTPGLLTARETAVMKCLAQGLRYKEIEDELHLSHAVVKKLQHRAYVKLGASSCIEALNRLLTIQ